MDNTQERILSINVRYDDAIRGLPNIGWHLMNSG